MWKSYPGEKTQAWNRHSWDRFPLRIQVLHPAPVFSSSEKLPDTVSHPHSQLPSSPPLCLSISSPTREGKFTILHSSEPLTSLSTPQRYSLQHRGKVPQDHCCLHAPAPSLAQSRLLPNIGAPSTFHPPQLLPSLSASLLGNSLLRPTPASDSRASVWPQHPLALSTFLQQSGGVGAPLASSLPYCAPAPGPAQAA